MRFSIHFLSYIINNNNNNHHLQIKLLKSNVKKTKAHWSYPFRRPIIQSFILIYQTHFLKTEFMLYIFKLWSEIYWIGAYNYRIIPVLTHGLEFRSSLDLRSLLAPHKIIYIIVSYHQDTVTPPSRHPNHRSGLEPETSIDNLVALY